MGTACLPASQIPKIFTADALLLPDKQTSIDRRLQQITGTNLIDNCYFPTAVNQLGQNTYGPNKNCIDRWRTGISVSVELTENGLKISRDGETGTSILQRLEHDRIPLDTVVTYSQLLANGTLLTATGKTPKEIPSTGYAQTILIDASNSLALLENGVWQITCGCITDKTSKTVVAVKFELGPFQTLAHREGNKWVLNDPSPDYTSELFKCKRYQRVFNYNSPGYGVFYGHTTSATTANVFLPVDVPMRANPAISDTDGSNWICTVDGQTITPKSIAPWFASRNAIGIRVNGDFPMGKGHALVLTANSAKNVIFDANL